MGSGAKGAILKSYGDPREDSACDERDSLQFKKAFVGEGRSRVNGLWLVKGVPFFRYLARIPYKLYEPVLCVAYVDLKKNLSLGKEEFISNKLIQDKVRETLTLPLKVV